MPDNRNIPACHEDGLVSSKLLSADKDGDISQDVPAAQPVQIEQNVTRMASELDAAVRCASHFVKIYNTKHNEENVYEPCNKILH